MKKLVFALVVGAGFAVSTLMAGTVSDTMSTASMMTAQDAPPDSDGDGIPDKPGGDDKGGDEGDPPAKPGEGDNTGGDDNPPAKPGEGDDTGSDDSIVLTGAYQYTTETNTLADTTLASTTSDQNVILAMTNAYVTVSNCVLNKSGDMSNEDNSNFYAVNAVVAAKSGSMICIADSELNSNASGANGLFASGSGSTIYAYDCEITSMKDSSRGLDATYKGTVIASKMRIKTKGDHCASLATDRGNGYISATDSTLETAGQGSPLIYSTGVIEVNSVTGTATGAQIAGIEGLSTIRIRNSDLSGSAKMASESVTNGVIIYQSNSGDYTAGTATFEVSDSTLTSEISGGAMFYITHSEAVITVQNTELDFDTSVNYLIKAAGNDGSNGWGTAGHNGGGVIFTAINQTLKGDISVDGISSNDLYLVNSAYTGTFIKDTTYTGNGGANVFIDADSTWTVTSNCTLKCLTAVPGATIQDAGGNTVSIVESGETVVSGTSAFTINVSDYSTPESFVATNITDFTISRTAFDKMYGTSGSEEGESGGSSDVGSTYYIKPHAPTNAVVWVYHGETRLYPDRDHKYWVDAYWTNGVGVTVNLSYKTKNGYLFADGSSSTNWTLQVTENKTEIYPPAGFETAYPAQAQNGATYYLTLEEAIEAVGDRSKIDLTPMAQSNEQAVVDAAITNEAVFASLVSTNASAKVTISPTTPGLYYWIQGGTDVGAITNAGTGVLSTNGGSIELSKPTLDATKGKAFFRIAAGVSAP